MLIAGFNKTSFVDYPGKLCSVVFTPFCNMRCPYCHNKHILSGSPELIPEQDVLEYLQKRRGILEGVVITGGEPTLRPNLPDFIRTVKGMGYLVKLDSNGMKPDALKLLFAENLLDYVAMDIKAPAEKYPLLCGVNADMDDIRASIALIMESGVDYEFRTTFAPPLTRDDVLEIGTTLISGARAYYLQQYRPNTPEDVAAHPNSYVAETADALRKLGTVGTVGARGL